MPNSGTPWKKPAGAAPGSGQPCLPSCARQTPIPPRTRFTPRSLDALVDAHLAAKFCDGEGPARYDTHGEAHYHLRCTKTGQVRDLPLPYDPQLPTKLDPNLVEALRRQGFHVTGHRLELLGYFDESNGVPSPASRTPDRRG
jgi:hypothetical protein